MGVFIEAGTFQSRIKSTVHKLAAADAAKRRQPLAAHLVSMESACIALTAAGSITNPYELFCQGDEGSPTQSCLLA